MLTFKLKSCLKTIAVFALVASCTTAPAPKTLVVQSDDNHFGEANDFHLPSDTYPGCLNMMNQYCESLYQPGHEGNLVLKTKSGEPIYVRQGNTPNGMSQVYYALAQSKLRNQKSFPQDFFSILHAHRYFEKLEELLNHKPRTEMTLTDRMNAMEQRNEVEYLWNLAVDETLLTRITQHFPNYPNTTDDLTPPEVIHYRTQERKILLSEIARANWKNDPQWQAVSNTFEELKKVYLQVIPTLQIPVSVQNHWADRISSMKLIPPGSIPELSDQECAGANVNAYYYAHYNVMTVCAGDFTSEVSLQTLAHEMSHAIDIDRSHYLFFKQSSVGKYLGNISKDLCSSVPKKVSCSDWKSFKSQLPEQIKVLANYEPEVLEFNRCLKRTTTKPMDEPTMRRFALQSSQTTIRELAEEEAFLRITQAQLPLPNGKKLKNPSYLNPCSYFQSNWESESLNSDFSAMVLFLAEYECADQATLVDKLKVALNTTENILTDIEAAMIDSEDEFSSRKLLVEENFSASPSERFADVMGSIVVAKYLASIQSIWDRRAVFLAGNSWLCSPPSLTQRFPEESLMLRQYVQDAHTDGQERMKELLSTPVQESLGCKLDFKWDACHL